MISYSRFFAEALVTGEEDSIVVRHDSDEFRFRVGQEDSNDFVISSADYPPCELRR